MNHTCCKENRRAVLRIVVAYVLFSGLWIYLSDTFLELITHDPYLITRIGIFKGFFFILVTSVILYRLMHRYLCSIARDLAERVKAEKQASFFRKLVEYTRDPVYALEHESGRMVYVNQATCAHFGMDRDLLLSMRIPDWDPVFDMNKIDMFRKRMKREGAIRFETVHRVASGEVVPVEVTANYLEHDGTALSAGYFHNIRERKAMESSLRDSETRFRVLSQEFQALFDGIPEILVLQSPELKILWANSYAAESVNREPSEMMGEHCYKLWHGLDEPCKDCPVQACFNSGRLEELNVQTPDGRVWDLRAIPIKDEAGKVVKVIEVGRDMTERRNLEQQLRHSQKMEAVGQLAGGIAHDFNNILTAIIGFSSLMLMKLEEDNPMRHYAEQILSSSEKAAVLTQGLLTFSRKKPMCLQSVDLNEIIKNGRDILLRLIREDIEFRTEPSPEPLIVKADSIQLEQVFMNLISNARDAMPDGGMLLIRTESFTMDDKFTHAHGYGKPGSYACISVTDSGCGMDEKTREKIFEPFFTTKDVDKGTGLGLATVYGIIKQHDGYINVYSEQGQGTTFRLYLPMGASAARETVKPESFCPLGDAETVLLTEDDEFVRKSNKETLENFGYTVIEATDGADAVDKFAMHKDQIDILILDVIMPKMNGHEVYGRLKEIRPDIKVIFISGYTEDFLARQGMLEANTHFVEKPVSPGMLLTKIREVINS